MMTHPFRGASSCIGDCEHPTPTPNPFSLHSRLNLVESEKNEANSWMILFKRDTSVFEFMKSVEFRQLDMLNRYAILRAEELVKRMC
jgi:hypothetical protein